MQPPDKSDYASVSYYLKRNLDVWVIEPFPIFKRDQGGVFLRQPPGYIQRLLNDKKISSFKTEYINAKEIYLTSANKAVSVVESVYPTYKEENSKIIKYVVDTLRSDDAEKSFKNDLCDKLAEFYSINIMLHRIEKYFNMHQLVVYPDINIRLYLLMKSIIVKSDQHFFDHPSIQFSFKSRASSISKDIKKSLVCLSLIAGQTIGSSLCAKKNKETNETKYFRYGITIISSRQFRKNKRSMDFMVDGQKILPTDIVYFPMLDMSDDLVKKIKGSYSEIAALPRRGRYFSNFSSWKRLLQLAFKNLDNSDAVYNASLIIFIYFKWKKVLESVKIKHFITHSDFGVTHVGRNIALNQSGAQTWYFIDSISYELNYRENMGCGKLFPFWTYLHYDHLISWHGALCDYLREHPGSSFKQTHVVGSLWGSHIIDRDQARKSASQTFLKDINKSFIIACFDSTYLMNSHISYADGITFANDLYRLVDQYEDIFILFKEKKERKIHNLLDPVLGPKLVDTYESMGHHARIRFYDNQADTSEIISISDMVITFPFSSPTFEALSVNKPAIWHDAANDYRKTLYGKIGGVLTHSYEELKEKVYELKTSRQDVYQNPIPMGSPLMDPYRDGKAIARLTIYSQAHDQ